MGKTRCITRTGIKMDVARANAISEDVLNKKLNALPAPNFEQEKELPLGRWFVKTDATKPNDVLFNIYTIEEKDLDKGYAELSEEAKRSVWEDGYKRTYVNRPNHVQIKEALGLVTKSVAKAEAEKAGKDRAILEVVKNAAHIGFEADQIAKLCNLTMDMVKQILAHA